MTTSIIVSPNEHPILVTLSQSTQHNGLHFNNFSQQILLPGDPKTQFHISKGGSIGVDELEADDARAVAESNRRNPTIDPNSDAGYKARGIYPPANGENRTFDKAEDPFKEERARARAPAD